MLIAVGGAAGTLSCNGGGHLSLFGVILGCLLCAVDAVARDVVVGTDHCWGIHICGWLVVVVGMHICGRLVVIVYVHIHRWLVVVVYVIYVGSWWSLCTFVFMGGWLLLSVVMSFVVCNVVVGVHCCSCSGVLIMEVIVVGGGHRLLLLGLVVVGGGRCHVC